MFQHVKRKIHHIKCSEIHLPDNKTIPLPHEYNVDALIVHVNAMDLLGMGYTHNKHLCVIEMDKELEPTDTVSLALLFA